MLALSSGRVDAWQTESKRAPLCNTELHHERHQPSAHALVIGEYAAMQAHCRHNA
jgi:hypothetical protein